MTHTATYSPEDDKIRIYLSYRLSAEDYAPIKAAGYHSAPKQGCVFAVWSPKAEDIALELCGEITDEDKSLVERAEERAERFEDYSDSRKRDAERAHAAVSSIADNIPLGQPILVGHHSERHARRDAQRIENGMRKAVQMWKTSEYWKDRAAGALAHAKYKERPDVRGRRIKTLEAELRKVIAGYTPHLWKDGPLEGQPQRIMQHEWNERDENAAKVPHVFVGPHGRGGHWIAERHLEGIKERSQRWIEHLSNRLEYEGAMLKEEIGVDDHRGRFDLQVGGRIRHGSAWLTITKLNKKDGIPVSVSTNNPRWPRVVDVEEITEYEAPSAEQTERVKAATKRPPLCNYPGEGFASCTAAEWKKINKDFKSQSHVIPATENHGAHCVRYTMGVYLNVQPKDDSYHEKINYRHRYYPVYLTDEKRKDPPPAPNSPPPTLPTVEREPQLVYTPKPADPEAEKFEALAETLKAGVHVVSANQLFPTPINIVRQMIEEADMGPEMIVLEPSAGTGRIVAALDVAPCNYIEAIEVNPSLVMGLRNSEYTKAKARCADFLECKAEEIGHFDRVLMNPPFENGADIKHILHALTFLKPGGRLVAICANGPRQNEKLKPFADSWEELPAGTFEGTQVRSVLLVINKPEQLPTENSSQVTTILAENPTEAAQHVAAGRSWPALKESRSFDTERLNESPLFARRLF